MKTLIHTLIAMTLLALIASCGGGSELDQKKKELEKLRTEQTAIAEKIKNLEKEIAASGDSSSDSRKRKDVLVSAVALQPFVHTIDVQGRVEGDENITLSAKMAGSIVKVNVKAGDQVKQGQVLAEIESEVMKAQLADLKSNYELAKDFYNRQKSLWDQKVGTEMQYLQAKTNKESLEQKIKSLTETWEMYLIKAPFNGTIDDVAVKVGQIVAPGVPAIRVVNLRNLKVKADLAEAYTAKVKAGNNVHLNFPDIDKKTTSKVSYSGKVINPMTRTFTVEVTLPSDDSYRPNMVAEVSIVDYVKEGAVVVPVNTIQSMDNKDYVYVAVKEGNSQVARKREVTVGETCNGQAEIKGGLVSGDLVITTGYNNLNDGELIRY